MSAQAQVARKRETTGLVDSLVGGAFVLWFAAIIVGFVGLCTGNVDWFVDVALTTTCALVVGIGLCFTTFVGPRLARTDKQYDAAAKWTGTVVALGIPLSLVFGTILYVALKVF
jgi:uncharacterized membrane protein